MRFTIFFQLEYVIFNMSCFYYKHKYTNLNVGISSNVFRKINIAYK